MVIKDGNIRAARGEDFALHFRVMENGKPYAMQYGDRIQLIVKKMMTAEEPALIDRTAVNNNVIRVKASDTEDLMIRKYRYMVRLIKSDGSKHILVDTHNFEIIGGNV